ncbi:hypothetical protein [Clostridium autoethanogenum]|uniref:hypothetical protein n=1 Tax=Clostridium autoethanogenum TaxID=84023 RepID=UPI001604F276|nr:hypothetical protein [Clostridium autoethanogenum]
MKKKILIITITIVILLAIGGGIFVKNAMEEGDPKNWGINPSKISDIVTNRVLQKCNSDLERIYGFQDKEKSKKNLSKVTLALISKLRFASTTQRPDKSKFPVETDQKRDFIIVKKRDKI